MKKGFGEYLTLLYQRIPETYYMVGIILLVLVSVIILYFAGFKKGWIFVVRLLLLEYLTFIYGSAVIFRATKDVAEYQPISFDSYRQIFEADSFYIAPELLLNILVFVPLGALVCLSFKKLRWWKAVIVGLGISVSIEVLQFAFRRGTSEVIDVFHNTLGTAIGVGLVVLMTYIFQRKSIVDRAI